uniref:Histone-lysine N-methyltransferase n=1 Tax=Elaeophora elaphi TaxID=1147741 RepID=A0A0R3S3H1_9BILA
MTSIEVNVAIAINIEIFEGVGKRECFICGKLEGPEDMKFDRCPSTSLNCNDGNAATADKDFSASDHNKIRKCSFPSCTLRFHENCFLTFTEGPYSSGTSDFVPRMHIFDKYGDLCANLKDSRKWLCPQHECNFCFQELLRKRAFLGTFIRCVKCVFAWHPSCVTAGSLHINRKYDRYVLCPRHNTLKRSSKRNIPYCIKCENSFENESQKVACDFCIRSFCQSCVIEQNNIKETEAENRAFACDFCLCFDFPRIGDYVLATYKSTFWPARTLHSDLLPTSLYSMNNMIEKLNEPGHVLIQWIEGLDIPNYDVVTCRDLVSFPKTLNCSFWKRMKAHPNIYKATEAIYASPEAAIGIRRPLPPEVKADTSPKYARIEANLNMNLAKASSDVVESDDCNCEPINGMRCTVFHDCLNRMLMAECPKNCDAAYFKKQNAHVGGTKRQIMKRATKSLANENSILPPQQMCANNFLRRHDIASDSLFMEEKLTDFKGFGAFAKCDIDEGTDLTEYVGLVVAKQEYSEKQNFRSSFNDLEESYYGMQFKKCDFCVDARNCGNIARSFNHSCEPNTKVDVVLVDGICRFKVSTIKNIKKGDELTFNYDTEIAEGLVGMECFCGSTNCRRIIGRKKSTSVKGRSALNEHTSNNNQGDAQSGTAGSESFSEIYANSDHSGQKHIQKKRRKCNESKGVIKDQACEISGFFI